MEQLPATGYPEFAVIGRSNVGKSSLINYLTGRKGLAHVSKTPGKTRTINHFLINEMGGGGDGAGGQKRGGGKPWYLVDLPGHGYAKRSKGDRLAWNAFTQDYFLRRTTLVSVLCLVDASVPPMAIDLECVDWLGDAEVPFCLVFTKCDKAGGKRGGKSAAAAAASAASGEGGASASVGHVAAFKERMLERWEYLPPCLETSAQAGFGRGRVLSLLAQLRENRALERRGHAGGKSALSLDDGTGNRAVPLALEMEDIEIDQDDDALWGGAG